jgi:hypothetical protein
MSLIVPQAGEVTLNPDIENAIIEHAEAVKHAKEEYDAFMERVQQAMEAEGLIKLETPRVRINYIAESDRETFQGKKFREDFPQLYDDYCTLTRVKASIRVKIK